MRNTKPRSDILPRLPRNLLPGPDPRHDPVKERRRPPRQPEHRGVRADESLRVDRADGFPRRGVRKKEIADELPEVVDLLSHREVPGRARREEVLLLPPGFEVPENQHGRLIDRVPETDVRPDPPGHNGCIACEQLRKDRAKPSPPGSRSTRPREMVERDERLHSGVLDRFHDFPVAGNRACVVPTRGRARRASRQWKSGRCRSRETARS